MGVQSYRDDYYSPAHVRTGQWAVLVGSGAVLVWVIAHIMAAGVGVQVLLGLGGVTATVGVVLGMRRWWMCCHARPALMRLSLSQVLSQPVPDRLPGQRARTVVASGYQPGTVTVPGPAGRVVLRAPFLAGLDPMMVNEMTRAISQCEGAKYRVKTNKRRPDRFVFTRIKPSKDSSEQAQPTKAQSVIGRFDHAVEQVFDSRAKVSYTWDEKETDLLLAVEITGISGVELALPGKQRQVVVRLKSQLPEPGAFRGEVYPNQDRLVLKRMAPLPTMVVPAATHPSLLRSHQQYQQFQVALGVGPDGQQAMWKPSSAPHLLIAGGTSGGKTICQHGVIQRLTQAGWRVWLIDGKRIELTGYRDWDNVEFLAQTVDAQIRLVWLAHQMMEERYDLLRDGKVSVADLDPVVIDIDEVTTFLETANQRYLQTKMPKTPSRAPILDWLGNIARLGRSAKVHLVYGMQRPDARFLEGEQRDNFAARISLGKLQSGDNSKMMWGNYAIGCQVPNIPGRGVSLIDGHPVQVQATLNANPDKTHPDYHAGMVEAMKPKHHLYSRKNIQAPVPTVDLDSGEEAAVMWPDLLEAKIVDAQGQEVIFDPVSSEESRRLRALPPEPDQDQDQYPVLQVAQSKDEALALFETHTRTDTEAFYGAELAQGIAQLLADGSTEFRITPATTSTAATTPAPISAAAEAGAGQPVPVGVSPGTGAGTDHSAGEVVWVDDSPVPQFEASLGSLRPGDYAEIDQIGEEIMISDLTRTGSGLLVSGYTADGTETIVELAAETEVLARRAGPEPAGDDEMEEQLLEGSEGSGGGW